MNHILGHKKLTILLALTLSLLIVMGGMTSLTAKAAGAQATLVLKNGIIYTMDAEKPTAEAVAIQDGKIIFVGTSTQANVFVGATTKVIDLQGKMVSPGFLDGHTHVPGLWTSKLFAVDLTAMKTNEEFVQAVAAYRKNHPEAKIITGTGWVNGPYELKDGTNPGPKKEDLDKVVSDIPVLLRSVDGHSTWVNSKVLEMAGVTKDTKSPQGGLIEHNPDGSVRGTLRDSARNLIADVQALGNLTKEQYKEAILKYQEEMHSFGMTGVLNLSDDKGMIIEAMAELEKEGKLTMRVANAINFKPGDKPEDAVKTMQEARNKYNSDWLRVNTVKLFADGVTEGKTAYFVEPYDRHAGMGEHYHGEPIWQVDDFNRMVLALDKAGVQLHIHAIGDGAVNAAINAFENAGKTNGTHDLRHTITHVCSILDSDITRMAKLGVVASLQPFWFYKDQYFDLEKAMIGEKRALDMYPTRKMWDAGVVITGGSDFPPTPDYRPLNGIETGVTRNSPYPTEQDTDMVRNAAQGLKVQEMLQAFTKNVAFEMNRSDLGAIKVGNKADLVVLGQDITKIAPKNISETPILYTIVDGKIVFEAKQQKN
ncbi:UNVERIFIED_CONTAM: putative amidohydrolase YtcJ [Brevibacillus sp. OAP136]